MKMNPKRNNDSRREADFAQACEWWDDLSNIWTPLGWKDHMMRFSVLWNGSVMSLPVVSTRTWHLQNEGMILTPYPGYDACYNAWRAACIRHDDGMVRQGWLDDAAPVLWSEWSLDGVLLRTEVFAHIAGGGATATGVEPLYAWIRLRIADTLPTLPLEKEHGFNLFILGPGGIITTMSSRDNIRFPPDDQRNYPRRLRPDTNKYNPARGWRILEDDGRVRLAVAPGGQATAAEFLLPQKHQGEPILENPTPDQMWTRLLVLLPARKGAFVDLLMPYLPLKRGEFDRELAVGYDQALRETRRFWKSVTATPTRFETPEKDINDTIKQSVRMSNMLTEKHVDTGLYCKINGSWVYAALWSTPVAMDLTMMLDILGYHDIVAQYLEIFRLEQGTVKPPGASYEKHPGYLSTPALYKSVDWLSDNGAVLYMIASHALLAGDKKFTERFADCMVKSCAWIRDSRAQTGHAGVAGILPPAVATDNGLAKQQALWAIGWNYKGLTTAIRALKTINHPKVDEFVREAREFKEVFLKVYEEHCRRAPTWRDAQGQTRRLPPAAFAEVATRDVRHAFFLDTGALFLVFCGLMEATHPMMSDILAWFREGPPHKFYRRDANCWQVPVLDHEMSSCEPPYSWNVFHSWQLGDRRRYLEGMYSVFAGSCSRRTRVSCETRGAVTGNVFAAPLAIYMARLAVIDDQLHEGELHLLRLMPLAWLQPGAKSRFDKVPTEYGPVTLRTELSADGKTLQVGYSAKYRHQPRKVVMHCPPVPGLKAIIINGKKHAVGQAGKKICLA